MVVGGKFITTKMVIMQFLKSNIFCFCVKRNTHFRLSFCNLVMKWDFFFFFVCIYLLAFSFPCSKFACNLRGFFFFFKFLESGSLGAFSLLKKTAFSIEENLLL